MKLGTGLRLIIGSIGLSACEAHFTPLAPDDTGPSDPQPVVTVDLASSKHADLAVTSPDLAVKKSFHDQCLSDLPAGSAAALPQYDQFNPIIGSHCKGTNQQDITGVEKVVFVGDSVTVGTPPTPNDDFYRTILTQKLLDKFGQNIPVESCAAWGAETRDLIETGADQQLIQCFPALPEIRKTLFIMTLGGNDMYSMLKDSATGKTLADMMANSEAKAQNMRDAINWIKNPVNFPSGSYVIFANAYEFTDNTGDTASCPVAALDKIPAASADYRAAFLHFDEQYLKLAVDTGTDMIFLLEQFCGHGYHKDDPTGVCYRGPNTDQYFDLTCIHPTPDGHQYLADMFMAVVNE